jgi:hypothetical protein
VKLEKEGKRIRAEIMKLKREGNGGNGGGVAGNDWGKKGGNSEEGGIAGIRSRDGFIAGSLAGDVETEAVVVKDD